MQEIKYIITDKEGIHARPAGLFVKEAAAFPCSVTIAKGEKQADAKRIFGVMGLGVKCGEEITVRTEGDREQEAITRLEAFLKENL
ncbi:MAG: HPr family phosphocarrier protein [Roseburia sp.]